MSIAATYVSDNSFTVVGDQTTVLMAGRRIRAHHPGMYKYGTISGSSYADPNTTITLYENNLLATLSGVDYGIIGNGSTQSLPIHTHNGYDDGTGGSIDHGILLGLSDDDHPQYHNDTRGDARYYTQTQVDTISGSLSTEIDNDVITHSASGDHDGRYYTEAEVDTISGALSTEIDSDVTTHASNASAHHAKYTDEEAQDAVGNIIAGAGTVSVTYDDDVPSITVSGSGVGDHGSLTGLTDDDHTQYLLRTDFTTYSGDIIAQMPTDYYTTGQVDTISGALSSEIDNDITTHAASGDHDGRYYTEAEITTISGDIVSQIPTDYISESEMTTISGDIVNQIPTDYYTTGEIATISGDIVAQIPTDYYTTGEIATISGDLQTQIDGKSNVGHNHDGDYVNITGDTMTGDLTIQGDLIVTGSGYQTNLEQLLIESNEQYMNYGEPGSGVTAGWAGWWIDRGDAIWYRWGYFESTDNFKVGASGSEQAVTTRDDSSLMTPSGISVWDGSQYTLHTYSDFTYDAGQVKVASTAATLDNHLTPKKYVDDAITTATGSLTTDHGALTGLADDDHAQYLLRTDFTTSSGDIISQIPSDYVSDAEMTTISGDIIDYVDAQVAAASGTTTLIGLTDTPNSYSEGLYLKSTTSGIEWATASGGGGGGMDELKDDTTPELGGDLDTGNYTISGTGTIITGDHATGSGVYEVVNVMFGTDAAPDSASGIPIGTLYIRYEA